MELSYIMLLVPKHQSKLGGPFPRNLFMYYTTKVGCGSRVYVIAKGENGKWYLKNDVSLFVTKVQVIQELNPSGLAVHYTLENGEVIIEKMNDDEELVHIDLIGARGECYRRNCL